MGIKGMTGLKRKVRNMNRDLDRKPKSSIESGSASTVAKAKELVVQQDAVASTDLYRGIEYERITSPRGATFIIRSRAGHSGFVEFGTGVHHEHNRWTDRYDAPEFSMALVGIMIEWASIKPSLRTVVDDPVTFGFAVARSVSGEAEGSVPGTKPQPFFRPAYSTRSMRRRAKNAVTRSV